MTLDDVNESARLAAETIRCALEKFHNETGMKAEVYADWLALEHHSGKEKTVLLSLVEVTPVFSGVRA